MMAMSSTRSIILCMFAGVLGAGAWISPAAAAAFATPKCLYPNGCVQIAPGSPSALQKITVTVYISSGAPYHGCLSPIEQSVADSVIRISGVFEQCDPIPLFDPPTPAVLATFEPIAPGHYTVEFTATTDPAFGPDGYVQLDDDSVVQAPISISGALDVAPAAGALPNYQGLWWAAPAGSEAGWGMNFAHQGNEIFVSWFTYDERRNPVWFVMLANGTASATYSGALYEATAGPSFDSVPFPPLGAPGGAQGGVVGEGTLVFSDPSNGTFSFTVDGHSQIKAITREIFGAQPNCTFGVESNLELATNYQDLWWVPDGQESGWGINLSHQGDTIFGTWFTYDLSGNPVWFAVATTKVARAKYLGTVYQTSGPPFSSASFPPIGSAGGATGIVVGSAELDFTNGNAAVFRYSVAGVSQSKSISREVFVAPGTVCQ